VIQKGKKLIVVFGDDLLMVQKRRRGGRRIHDKIVIQWNSKGDRD
jgi:hypothetical protein